MVHQAGVLANLLVRDAMIRNQDEQGVLPGLCLTELLNETPQTLIQVVEGIQDLIVQLPDGHIPRGMTAQRGVANEIRTFGLRGHLVERLEGDAVAHTPSGGGTLLGRIVVLRHERLETA